LTGDPESLSQDQQGRLWASTTDGVFYFESGRFIRVPGVPGGRTYPIVGDQDGNVWISNVEAGLFHVTPQLVVQRIPWSQFGHKFATALLTDRLQGALWLGFFDGGIAYLKNDHILGSYTSAEGLGNGEVSGLRFDSDGALWAATEGGLSLIKDGHITTLTSKNGLPCDAVHWLTEDDNHAIWLYKPCGLARIARSDLDAWVNDPKRIVHFTILGAADGVRSYAIPSGYPPMVTKSPDGKIWFLQRDGVGVIDPLHLPYNGVPPPVHIEQITADRKTYDASPVDNGRLKLPPLVRDLTIDYTALSLAVPEKVLFRYKLEGRDRDWEDVGTRRQAFYSDLRPHDYRFRVMACNNSGVWNEEGATLDFAIAPAYYQTTWFCLSCVAAFLALLWGLYEFLQSNERKFRRAYDQATEAQRLSRTGSFTWDVQADDHAWSEEIYRIFGFEPGTKVTMEMIQSVIHPEDRPAVEATIRRAAEGADFDLVFRIVSPGGAVRHVHGVGHRIEQIADRPVLLGAVQDVTESKLAEDALNKARSELAHVTRVTTLNALTASIAHEVN